MTKKIRIAQLGTIDEHASGKMSAARQLTDCFEAVGAVGDSACTTARQNAAINPKPYEHELLVQEVLLAACGSTNWSK